MARSMPVSLNYSSHQHSSFAAILNNYIQLPIHKWNTINEKWITNIIQHWFKNIFTPRHTEKFHIRTWWTNKVITSVSNTFKFEIKRAYNRFDKYSNYKQDRAYVFIISNELIIMFSLTAFQYYSPSGIFKVKTI